MVDKRSVTAKNILLLSWLYAQTLASNFVFFRLHSGHFITVDERVQEDQGKAVLLGPDVDQQDWSCFRMVYQVTGSASLQVQKRTDGESFDQVLWTTQSPSDSWLIASIDLQNSSETYKVRTIYTQITRNILRTLANVLARFTQAYEQTFFL